MPSQTLLSETPLETDIQGTLRCVYGWKAQQYSSPQTSAQVVSNYKALFSDLDWYHTSWPDTPQSDIRPAYDLFYDPTGKLLVSLILETSHSYLDMTIFSVRFKYMGCREFSLPIID